jgi:hypothetical protein
MTSPVAVGTLVSAYIRAKMEVMSAGYTEEIIWQRQVSKEEYTEREFLRECAWVILCSGMREAVVRQKFPSIGEAFLDWSSAHEITHRQQECVTAALVHFGHRAKMKAIVDCACIIQEKGFESLRRELKADPINTLQQFPYIGPATSYHVAKNIGFAVAKPDRHLSRLAEISGYPNPSELCKVLADYIGDPVAVVDIVLWRFATLRPDYRTSFLRKDQCDA